MKKFKRTEVTTQNTQPTKRQTDSTKAYLLELLPQITKILPNLQSFFQKTDLQQQNAPQQPCFLTENYQKNLNRKAVISSIENHKKFVKDINCHQ